MYMWIWGVPMCCTFTWLSIGMCVLAHVVIGCVPQSGNCDMCIDYRCDGVSMHML